MPFLLAVFDGGSERPRHGRAWAAGVDALRECTSRLPETSISLPLVDLFAVGCTDSRGLPGLCVVDGRPTLPSAGGAVTEERGPGEVLRRHRASGVQAIAGAGGHYAVASVDPEHGSLLLARDRFGSVPLHWARVPGATLASTHVTGLLPFLPTARPNPAALAESLRFRYLTGPGHLLDAIRRVEVGSAVMLARGRRSSQRYEPLLFAPEDDDDLETWVTRTHQALHAFFDQEAPAGRRIGVLLSGGVDSSVLAAAARERSADVVGYVAAVDDPDGDEEVRRAQVVADRLGIPLTVVTLREDALASSLRALVRVLGEPPRHPNNLVLDQLYEVACREVDVVLQGDAAEMMFGLHDSRRVEQFGAKRNVVGVLPGPLRRGLVRGLKGADGTLSRRVSRLLSQDALEFALSLDAIEYGPTIRGLVMDAWTRSGAAYPQGRAFEEYADFDDALHAYQARTFLQCSLVRHYGLSRRWGVDALAPFVSDPLVAVALSLPRVLRWRERPRPVVQALCDRMVHPEVSQWPKLGFPVPWRRWMEGPLSALRGSPADYVALEDVLPEGFVAAAFDPSETEAAWTLTTLRMALEGAERTVGA